MLLYSCIEDQLLDKCKTLWERAGVYACRGMLMTETVIFALRCALHAVSDCATASAQCVQGISQAKLTLATVSKAE